MNKSKYILFVSVAIIAMTQFTSFTFAQVQSSNVPNVISYQGIISDASGHPIDDGLHTITVNLYADENGKHRVWNAHYQTVVSKGVLTLNLDRVIIQFPVQIN